MKSYFIAFLTPSITWEVYASPNLTQLIESPGIDEG